MVGVSTGLEPYFSFTYYRSGRLGKFIEVKAEIVEEYLERNPEVDPNNLPDWFISSMSSCTRSTCGCAMYHSALD